MFYKVKVLLKCEFNGRCRVVVSCDWGFNSTISDVSNLRCCFADCWRWDWSAYHWRRASYRWRWWCANYRWCANLTNFLRRTDFLWWANSAYLTNLFWWWWRTDWTCFTNCWWRADCWRCTRLTDIADFFGSWRYANFTGWACWWQVVLTRFLEC